MTPLAHTGSTFEKLLKREICKIKSSTHWLKLRIFIAYSSGEIKLWKFQWRHSRLPEVLSKKLLKCEICRIKSSTHWRKLRINIVNSSGEIKLWKFKSNHSRIPEVISKKLLQHDKCSIYSSIHWRKLRINIAYSSVEIKLKISMTSFAHTGSTFEKVAQARLM